MKRLEIRRRVTDEVLFEGNASCVRDLVAKAVKCGANLRSANLSDADLSGADLSGADLSGADLSDANLRSADLSDADLNDADLRDANLSDAYLRDADLSGADLSDANLRGFRDDLWAVLDAAPAEVPALRSAIAGGLVDGSTYKGECACLVGTIANARGCDFNKVVGLEPDASRPAEMFFLSIREGDTPETNQFSAIALEWVDAWLANRNATGIRTRGEK